MESKLLTIASVGAIVFAVDQLAKGLALRFLSPGVPVPLIDGFFALRLGFNPGLAFGLLADLHNDFRWLVTTVSLVALVILGRVAYRVLPAAGPGATLAIGLVFGGAVGNLADRARHGAVVDFLDLHWRHYHWPAFNAADSAITIGVTLLAVALTNPRSNAPGGSTACRP